MMNIILLVSIIRLFPNENVGIICCRALSYIAQP